MMSTVLLLMLALALVAANAFFVATEFALVKVRITRLDELARQGSRTAVFARDMARHVDAYLSACQLGITVASLGLGWIGEPAFARVIGSGLAAVGLEGYSWLAGVEAAAAFLILTTLHIVVGELAPKSLAIQRTEPVALCTALPMQLFFKLTSPFIHALNRAGNAAVRLLGLPPTDHATDALTLAELRLMLRDSQRAGNVDASERELLDNAFEFSARTVRQVMRPRGDCTYLSLTEPLDGMLERVRQTGYTRYPLCKSDLDEVIGVVHVKDLLLPAKPLTTSADLVELRRDILFVPETVGIAALLARMRRTRQMMAICVDEYGVVAGLCTMEDILEELVGEIQDEHDAEAPPIRATAEGALEVEGTMRVADLSDRLMIEIPSEADTIAGYVMSRLGRLPRTGDELTIENYRLTVAEVRGLRLVRVIIAPML